MEPKGYRPLQPAPNAGSTGHSIMSTEGRSHLPVKRTRAGVQVACNHCRSRKTRCDGAHPICSPCKKRGIGNCVYDKKRSVGKEALELLELLKSSTDSTAIDLLRLLRTNAGPAVVLSLVRETSGGQNLSMDDPILDEIVPDVSPLEFELMIKHPISYPNMRYIDSSLRKHNDFLHSVDVINTEFLESWTTSSSNSVSNANNIHKIARNNSDSDSPIRRLRDKNQSGPPHRIPGLCDERLNDLDISFWTNIQIPNKFAAKVISLYLETDHPLLGTFEPGQFVDDLVNHRRILCSPFLVSTLLYWGCQMYSAIDKSANKYTQQLSQESKRLWVIEKNTDSILNMIGAQILSLAFMGHGKDHDVLLFQIESVKMGMRMGLLGVDDETAALKLANVPEEKMHIYAFAAWGVFNWAVLVATFHRQPGLLYLRFPPTLAIPGNTVSDSPAGSNLASLGNATTGYKFPSYMGSTFPAICTLWRIMREVSLFYLSDKVDPISNRFLNFAELKYRELLAWMEKLPIAVTRGIECPHHVVIFHMWIHSAILEIFRPFIQQEQEATAKSPRLRTFSAANNSFAAVYKASVNQLKQLIFHYRSDYDSASYTILWQTALKHVATAVRQDKEDPTWKSWFLFCIHGYKVLERSFPIAETIGRGLLNMAMRDTDISSNDARNLMRELGEYGLSGVEDGIQATFVGDLSMAD